MANFEITVTSNENEELFNQLVEGVRSFNAEILGAEKGVPLVCCAKDDKGQLIGGVYGRTIYESLLIEVLWVDKNFRGQGIGKLLVNETEFEAMSRGCSSSQVDTLSFQGIHFYQKLGFVVIGTVKNFPKGYDRHFLVKTY